MVVFAEYPRDTRVRYEAEALVETGMSVDIFCVRTQGESARQVVNGVSVMRIPLQRRRGIPLQYLWEYAHVLVVVFIRLTLRHSRQRYDIVQIHNDRVITL